jgi:5-formyltetrahydrofolate cyclo-ligase
MTKDEIRNFVWSEMDRSGVSRFPGTRGRIPNFKGAEKCAELLHGLEEWKKAKVLKANPDSPQRQVRYFALKEGKLLYMAVPRLASSKPFIELDPKRLPPGKLYEASSIRGASAYGRPVSIKEMRQIDLVICGSVAVSRDGVRIGKGEGYSELEFALASEAGKISADTTLITTVHPVQIIDMEVRLKPHDFTVDFVITPDEIIRCKRNRRRPKGIYWNLLSAEKIEAIPALREMQRRKSR